MTKYLLHSLCPLIHLYVIKQSSTGQFSVQSSRSDILSPLTPRYRLHPLQLLLPDCTIQLLLPDHVCPSYCSLIASHSAAAPRLHLLPLLLPNCLLPLLLPDYICFISSGARCHYCSLVVSACSPSHSGTFPAPFQHSTILRGVRGSEVVVKFEGRASLVSPPPPPEYPTSVTHRQIDRHTYIKSYCIDVVLFVACACKL